MPQLPLIVPKLWGWETWLVNEPEYCFKVLEINQGAACSLHYHPIKKETFIVQRGRILLQLDKIGYIMGQQKIMPITIMPGTPHRFSGIESSMILEISTHHDDEDCVRIEPSRGIE